MSLRQRRSLPPRRRFASRLRRVARRWLSRLCDRFVHREPATTALGWSDGTSHLLFEPLELLEKLAALTARPRINLILSHGALAPHARWRSRIVPEPAAETLARGANPEGHGAAGADDRAGPPRPRRRWRWADLIRRAFDIDVLACPRCGNRMRLLATIEDPRLVKQTLSHLGLPTAPVRPDPAQPPPERVADLAAAAAG